MSNKGDLVLSLRDQPRAEGSRKEHTLNWTVPEGWDMEVLSLPAGTVIPLQVAITSIDEGVLVEVEGSTTLVGQCVRCLEPAVVPVEISAADVYLEAPSKGKRRARGRDGDIEVTGDEFDEELAIDQDTVDLEPLLRDELFSDAPLQPLCSEDCLGICEHCGRLFKDLEPGHSHQFIDPRFAALAALLEDGGGSDSSEGGGNQGSQTGADQGPKAGGDQG